MIYFVLGEAGLTKLHVQEARERVSGKSGESQAILIYPCSPGGFRQSPAQLCHRRMHHSLEVAKKPGWTVEWCYLRALFTPGYGIT